MPNPKPLPTPNFWTQIRAMLDERQAALYEDNQLSAPARTVRFWWFVWTGFVRNRGLVRASSLAYSTLMALVPLLAIGISISTTLLKTSDGKEKTAQAIRSFVERVAPQLAKANEAAKNNKTNAGPRLKASAALPAVTLTNGTAASLTSTNAPAEEEDLVEKAVTTIQGSIDNINSGALGVTAMLALMFMAISLLTTIENAVNDTWGILHGRNWMTRIVLYWTTITLGAVVLLGATAMNLGSHFSVLEVLQTQTVFFVFVREFIQIAVLCLVFAVFYQLMPNTRVQWRAALVGGIVAGCLWHLNNSLSGAYVGQVMRNRQIYSTLGLVPVFLVGLYFTWVILLFGAQAAYAYQNRRVYFQELLATIVNKRSQEFVAFRLMTYVAQRFLGGQKPASRDEIAEALQIPTRLVSKILEPLLQTGLLLETRPDAKGESAFSAGRPIEKITALDILEAMRTGVGREISTRDDADCERVRGHFDRLLDAERTTAGRVTLAVMAREPLASAGA